MKKALFARTAIDGDKSKIVKSTAIKMIGQSVLLLLSAGLCGAARWQTFVRLPHTYTAMKGDIPVTFRLGGVVNFTSTAMVHLTYLPSDSFLLRSQHPAPVRSNMDAVPVASLAVPMGVRDGTVIFPCGTVVQAGPHVARLTVDGVEVAVSEVLEVTWPSVNIIVPSRLETYSNDVKIEAKFTTNLCSAGQRRSSSPLPFQVKLELVECSRQALFLCTLV